VLVRRSLPPETVVQQPLFFLIFHARVRLLCIPRPLVRFGCVFFPLQFKYRPTTSSVSRIPDSPHTPSDCLLGLLPRGFGVSSAAAFLFFLRSSELSFPHTEFPLRPWKFCALFLTFAGRKSVPSRNFFLLFFFPLSLFSVMAHFRVAFFHIFFTFAVQPIIFHDNFLLPHFLGRWARNNF